MELTLIIIGLIFLAYVMYTYVLRKRNTISIPGPMGIPLIGSAFRINPRIMHLQLHELASKYGKIFELTFFHKKAVVLNDVELIEKALARDGEYFNDRPNIFLAEELSLSQSVGGRSLNEDYRFARKAFAKGIHLYGSGIQKFESVVSGELKRLVKEIGDYEGGEFEVTGMFKRSVLNIMSILVSKAFIVILSKTENYLRVVQFDNIDVHTDSCSVKYTTDNIEREGKNAGWQHFLPFSERFSKPFIQETSEPGLVWKELIGIEATDDDAKAVFSYLAGMQFFIKPSNYVVLSLFPFLKHLPVYKRQLDKLKESKRIIFDRYFYQTKDHISTEERDGVVKELLKARQLEGDWTKLTDEMIQSMALGDILIGGNYSTSAVVPGVILCLVHHPEYQQKLQEELDSVIGFDRDPVIRDRHSCVLLEAIFLETIRLMIPGALSVPRVCNQDRQFEGYYIKADTQVFANSWYIHHDENIWGDPWNFRPERFIGEDGNIVPNDHTLKKNLLTFGVGVRRCPGISIATSRIFLYIAYIFQRYTFEAVPGKFRSCDPRTDDDFELSITLAAKPFYCRAKRRREHNTQC